MKVLSVKPRAHAGYASKTKKRLPPKNGRNGGNGTGGIGKFSYQTSKEVPFMGIRNPSSDTNCESLRNVTYSQVLSSSTRG
jgi:hypothetical protein